MTYNELGISGLCDRRNQNQGSKPVVEDVEQVQLWQVLQTNAPNGGLTGFHWWTEIGA